MFLCQFGFESGLLNRSAKGSEKKSESESELGPTVMETWESGVVLLQCFMVWGTPSMPMMVEEVQEKPFPVLETEAWAMTELGLPCEVSGGRKLSKRLLKGSCCGGTMKA